MYFKVKTFIQRPHQKKNYVIFYKNMFDTYLKQKSISKVKIVSRFHFFLKTKNLFKQCQF